MKSASTHQQAFYRPRCHELKVDEPAFTKEELLAICNAEKEEDKRRMFSEIMARKMKCLLPKEAIMSDIPMDDYKNKLIVFMAQRYDVITAKKKAMSNFNERIKELDHLIEACHTEIVSGQGNLFDHVQETANVP